MFMSFSAPIGVRHSLLFVRNSLKAFALSISARTKWLRFRVFLAVFWKFKIIWFFVIFVVFDLASGCGSMKRVRFSWIGWICRGEMPIDSFFFSSMIGLLRYFIVSPIRRRMRLDFFEFDEIVRYQSPGIELKNLKPLWVGKSEFFFAASANFFLFSFTFTKIMIRFLCISQKGI